MDTLLQLVQSYTSSVPIHTIVLTSSGSNRKYVRFTFKNQHTIIGVVGNSVDENKAFVKLSRHFKKKQLPVPEVLAVSDDYRFYLQEDLGSISLFDALHNAREAGEKNQTDGDYGDAEYHLLANTIRWLAHFQIIGADGLDFSICYPQPEMDEMNVMFDLNYFKYCYLKPSGVDFHEVKLELDFRSFAHDLCAPQDSNQPATFLYRDFQARNIMLVNEIEPYFIDFQGGRKGPIYYDLASFLWQASARYPQIIRDKLLVDYADELSKLHWKLPKEGLIVALQPWLLFRNLQVLGAYGFRGYYERKQYFIDSIPQSLANLSVLLEKGICKYPYLNQVLQNLLVINKI